MYFTPEYSIGSVVEFLFCRYDGKQVNNERQQQDRNKNKEYCAEIVGLGMVIAQ